MLADLLVSLITGSENFKLEEPKNAFHIYAQILKYYKKKNFPVELRNVHLNMPEKLSGSRKLITLTEMEWMFRNTFFNFVYRLKGTANNQPSRFMDISQALKHAFLITKKTSQSWNLPAEY